MESAVLERCRSGPVTVDALAAALDLGLADAALALARLERSGWLYEEAGWFEVTDG